MPQEFLEYQNFIQNKYFNWYIKIIEHAINSSRSYDKNIHENHHILPDSLGGTIITPLTFREHYICHLLLTKFTKGKDKTKMAFSLHTFFHFGLNRPTTPTKNRLYEYHKKIYRQALCERVPHHDKNIYTFKNRKTEQVFIGTRLDFKQYSGLSSGEIYNIITPNNNLRHSKNWGVYLPETNTFSYENKRKSANYIKIKCEYCNKEVSGQNYKRWHGEKCKIINPKLHAINTFQIKNLNKS